MYLPNKPTTGQSRAYSCRSQTSQCSWLSAQFYRDGDKSHVIFIKIVHNRRNGGVDCFNPYRGESADAVSDHWITPKSQPWSYFCLDVPWITGSLCTGASTKGSFHPALYWGIRWALWSKCAPLKTGNLDGLLRGLLLARSAFFVPV